jgi:hypothetical protein
LIADVQWQLADYEGARESFEAIREADTDNVPANLALANIYERLSRRRPALLVDSDHAIDRVLASREATTPQRVEALALKGRNHKTRWRRAFMGLATVDERRQAAMNQTLRASYDAYQDAFSYDLNHFWSGLAALQMGTIFLDLSEGNEGAWQLTFDNDQEADAYR